MNAGHTDDIHIVWKGNIYDDRTKLMKPYSLRSFVLSYD